MRVKLLSVARHPDSSIAPSTCERKLHWLLEELETLDIFDGVLRRFGIVKDDKGLALCLEICFRDDVNHISILREDCLQGFLENLWLDTLFEVADIDAVTVS